MADARELGPAVWTLPVSIPEGAPPAWPCTSFPLLGLSSKLGIRASVSSGAGPDKTSEGLGGDPHPEGGPPSPGS